MVAAHEGEAERLSRQAEESRAGQSDLQTRTDEISGQITEHKTALAALEGEIVRNTKALVKKQRTWFRTQLPPHRVVNVADGAAPLFG